MEICLGTPPPIMNPPMPITNILLAAATLGINPGCLLWSPILIGATQSLSGFLRREKVIQWMDRTTGMIFVLFAARLAFSKR